MKKWTALLLCCALLTIPAAARAEDGTVTETAALTFELPEESAQYEYRLSDGLVTTRISFKAEETFAFLPDEPVQAAVLSWYTAPESYVVSQLDETGASLGETSVSDGFLNQFIALDESCAKVVVTADAECALAGVTAYAADGELPADVQRWEASPEQADLLLITAEPGAEWKQLGAVLPDYTFEKGIKTAIVYLSDYGKRERADEALAALWSAGVRQYPIFAGFTCNNYDSAEVVEKAWGSSQTVKYVANLFETLQPKVVVADGLNDASGAHRFAAECIVKAAEKAGTVEKLYTFGETGETAATIAEMDTALNAFDGETAAQVAQTAFEAHASQQLFGKTIDSSGAYTLQYTNVGEDEAKNDLFEHIDPAALLNYSPVTPSPTPTQAPTPTPEPTAEPTPQASAPVRQSAEAADGSPQLLSRFGTPALVLAAGLVLSVLFSLLFYRRIRRARSKGDAICVCILPLAVALAACAVLAGIRDGSEQAAIRKESELAAVATPEAETPSPTPEAETPSPTPEPTPAPEAELESWYRTENEPEEVVEIDAEQGRWAYRTDDLGIEIERISATNADGKPLTYFVADIHMKDIYQFRPGFGSEGRTGRGATYPWIIARRAKAVLWITGDNLINSEKEEKGILIRDGKIYSYVNAEDTLAIYPDMSMRIFEKWETRANILLEDGVENSFSFGPTLIKDGIINADAIYHRIRRANPRAGIGYYEPGHYLAIVVDGRQKDYSVGMKIEEFAQLFADYGCTLAYNLDGGLSAAMVFMGEQLNSHSGQRTGKKNDISYQRAVPDGLMFGYSELVPSEDDPIYNNGNMEK